jgi:hypothetical protein
MKNISRESVAQFIELMRREEIIGLKHRKGFKAVQNLCCLGSQFCFCD